MTAAGVPAPERPMTQREEIADVWWRVRHRPWLPYSLRCIRISLDLHPFGFWLKPSWHHRKSMTEIARQQGETIWWARWAWFQISYSRWV